MSVLAPIAVLAILIVVHEMGHFFAARLQGIHVNRFSIGFGPALFKIQGPQTEYAIRAIPLGGYVGFPDDDPESEIPLDDPDRLQNRPILDRAIVISAGVIANLIFAYLVFVVQFGAIGVPDGINYQPGVLIPQVLSAESPAAQAGIKAGDVILAVDDRSLGSGDAALKTLTEAINTSPNQPIEFTVQRGDRQLEVNVTPQIGDNSDGKARIGVQLLANGKPEYRRAEGIGEVLTLAARSFQDMFVRTVQGFASLITNFSQMANQVSGPVGIVKQGADLANNDLLNLFPFTAIISINLAIINILPLPALDGGQLAFLLVEALRGGKPLPNRIQENVMQTGLMLLLGLGIFLIIRDTLTLSR
ncbi:RIP metalloprotease RseP [Microcoleus sp. FACHB-1515]|uniref:RIP metalloprotease RseP n=1 Tax=Cyanophyceae TaxID=3028117 RepID=UPI00168305C3|nr:RIP metalloprotease RseP [Microcoleus sp. FACHB-1515]MBD2093203.1 RIP metalloprotease RseP [Microcoleus sp. FACHB-1515]